MSLPKPKLKLSKPNNGNGKNNIGNGRATGLSLPRPKPTFSSKPSVKKTGNGLGTGLGTGSLPMPTLKIKVNKNETPPPSPLDPSTLTVTTDHDSAFRTPQTPFPAGQMQKFVANPVKFAQGLGINQLKNLLQYLSHMYYNQQEVVTDAVYDQLEDLLRLQDPTAEILKKVGAAVEYDPRKVPLPVWMGSMDKVKPSSKELANFLSRTERGPYLISDKLDGISVLVVYNASADGAVDLYTRGDGKNGLDISHLAPYFNLPSWEQIQEQVDLPDNGLVLRGEIILSRKKWVGKYKDSGEYVHPRGMAAGLINSKHPDPKMLSDLDLLAYEVIEPSNWAPERQFDQMQGLGFQVAPAFLFSKKDLETEPSEQLEAMLGDRRKHALYEIDGLILTQNKAHTRNTSGNPKYSTAFKANQVGQKTKVITVDWNASRHGVLKPRLEFETVYDDLGKFEACTAFNAAFIRDNKVGPDTIIRVVRSGDVIPYVTEVIKGTGAQMPIVPYEWNETQIDVLQKGTTKDIIIEQLLYFFKKLNTKYLSKGTISKMVDAGGLDSVSKILGASPEVLASLPGMGEKSVERILESLQESLANTGLAQLMAASGQFGFGLGQRKIQFILDLMPNVVDWPTDDWPLDAEEDSISPEHENQMQSLINFLVKAEGIQEKTALRFAINLPKFKHFMATEMPGFQLPSASIIGDLGPDSPGSTPGSHPNADPSKAANTNAAWKGLKVVFTGFRNQTWEKQLAAWGANVASAVTGRTKLVVAKDPNSGSSKLTKAKNLNLPILSQEEFQALFENPDSLPDIIGPQ